MLQYFCSVSKVHIGKGTWWLPTWFVLFLLGLRVDKLFLAEFLSKKKISFVNGRSSR